jgi:hypothetical protein
MSIEIMKKYQEILASAGVEFSGNEIHCFHADFVDLLDGLYDVIDIDSLKSFDEFPTNQGLYFCVRNTAFRHHSEVWYVGKARNFRARWQQHHKFQALKAIQGVRVYCMVLDDFPAKLLCRAEEICIDMLKPVFNGTSQPEKHLRLAA